MSVGRRSALSPAAPTVTVTHVHQAGGVTPAWKAAVTVTGTAPAPSFASAGEMRNSIPVSLSVIVREALSTVKVPPPAAVPTRLMVSSGSPVVSSSNTSSANEADPLRCPAGMVTRTDSGAR